MNLIKINAWLAAAATAVQLEWYPVMFQKQFRPLCCVVHGPRHQPHCVSVSSFYCSAHFRASRPHAHVPALIKAVRLSFPCSRLRLPVLLPLPYFHPPEMGVSTPTLGETTFSARTHTHRLYSNYLLGFVDPEFWILLGGPSVSFMIQLFAIRCWRHQQ